MLHLLLHIESDCDRCFWSCPAVGGQYIQSWRLMIAHSGTGLAWHPSVNTCGTYRADSSAEPVLWGFSWFVSVLSVWHEEAVSWPAVPTLHLWQTLNHQVKPATWLKFHSVLAKVYIHTQNLLEKHTLALWKCWNTYGLFSELLKTWQKLCQQRNRQ